MTDKTVKVTISGQVQGVFFRAWTTEHARELGLMGWVRNLSTGEVEAIFSGTDTIIEDMIKSCWVGPPEAKVTDIRVVDTDEEPEPIFCTKPTL